MQFGHVNSIQQFQTSDIYSLTITKFFYAKIRKMLYDKMDAVQTLSSSISAPSGSKSASTSLWLTSVRLGGFHFGFCKRIQKNESETFDGPQSKPMVTRRNIISSTYNIHSIFVYIFNFILIFNCIFVFDERGIG